MRNLVLAALGICLIFLFVQAEAKPQDQIGEMMNNFTSMARMFVQPVQEIIGRCVEFLEKLWAVFITEYNNSGSFPQAIVKSMEFLATYAG